MSHVASYQPVQPSPLSHSHAANKLDPDFSNQRHSQHLTFQQILQEINLENSGQNSVIGFHEFKDTSKPPHNPPSAKPPVAKPPEHTLAMAGAILTSSDILLSSLLDGPYRQAQSKTSKLLISPKLTGKNPGVPLDSALRSSHTKQRMHSSSRDGSVRSSSQSDYGVAPSRLISRPSSPRSSIHSVIDDGRFGYRSSQAINSNNHSRSYSSSFSYSRSEPSSPQQSVRSRPSSPQLRPTSYSLSRPGSPQPSIRTKPSNSHHSRPGSPMGSRDKISSNSSHSHRSSHSYNPSHSSQNMPPSRSSHYSTSSDRSNSKARSLPPSPQLRPSSPRFQSTSQTTSSSRDPSPKGPGHPSSRKHHQEDHSRTRSGYDKELTNPRKGSSSTQSGVPASRHPSGTAESSRSPSGSVRRLTSAANDRTSFHRGSHSATVDMLSLQNPTDPRGQPSSHRSSKSMASVSSSQPYEQGNVSSNKVSPKEQETQALVDWSFIENVDAKLAYNHLTKEARLVYFEDGIYPKKKLLPKGKLIPPTQLTMDLKTSCLPFQRRSTSTRVSSVKPKLEPSIGTATTYPPTLPKKSPARKKSRLLSPKSEPLPSESTDSSTLSLNLNGIFDSSVWGTDSSTTKSPTSSNPVSDTSAQIRSNKTRSIIDLLSKASGTKIASLSQCDGSQPSTSPMSSMDDDVNEKAWALSADPKSLPGALSRRPSSAFEKRIRVSPEPTATSTTDSYFSKSQQWFSQFRQQGDNSAMCVTGKESCAILCGTLYKLGGNRQWQKREFRADGFLLVCLNKEQSRIQSDPIAMEQPNYFENDWRSYCHPTTPPTPHITHPLVASPSTKNHTQMDYYQAPKWVIPIGDIVEVSLLTRKGVRVPDSFVIHTRSRNYILKALNSHELASWIYMLQRMIVTYQDCRVLMPGFNPDVASRNTSTEELSSLSTKDLGLRFKPVSTHSKSRDRDSNRKSNNLNLRSKSLSQPTPQDLPSPGSRQPRTDSTRLLQQQGRRASSLFHTHFSDTSTPAPAVSELQLHREIAHDWIGGLASLSYCKRPRA